VIKLELIEKKDLNTVLEWNAEKSADDLIQWAGPLYDYPLNIEQLENYFLDKVKNENFQKINGKYLKGLQISKPFNLYIHLQN
jgi:hypothetical protein